ncbi:Nicotinamidase [Methylocella tundrae]|uniref:Nicotinamidase n=2 Tax=Methylocella tundrae TaxID=227605 RepID=A0A4U8Z2Q9_METTU|nr:Nicotinamidase [Methylocella tundrae]
MGAKPAMTLGLNESERTRDGKPGDSRAMRPSIQPSAGDVLLVVDLQNDFCPGGRLAVPHGDEAVALINRLAARFEYVVLTQDWHPRGHLSFASTHGRAPFEMIEASYGPQILWPDHCVQDTPGAALHKDLHIPHAELILRKGFRRGIDSYSAFFENDRMTPTGLAGYLRERGFSRIFIAGLAFDFCVRYSAEDAKAHGFSAVVIEDACRAIDVEGSVEATRKSFAEGRIETLMIEAFA